MSYGLNAVLKQFSHSNDAVLDPSALKPPACDEAPSTR
jgi:hypothetical protein